MWRPVLVMESEPACTYSNKMYRKRVQIYLYVYRRSRWPPLNNPCKQDATRHHDPAHPKRNHGCCCVPQYTTNVAMIHVNDVERDLQRTRMGVESGCPKGFECTGANCARSRPQLLLIGLIITAKIQLIIKQMISCPLLRLAACDYVHIIAEGDTHHLSRMQRPKTSRTTQRLKEMTGRPSQTDGVRVPGNNIVQSYRRSQFASNCCGRKQYRSTSAVDHAT